MNGIKGLTARQPKRYKAELCAGSRSFWGWQFAMVDNFSILLSHALLLIAFWYLTMRNDLDAEAPPKPDTEPEGFARQKPKPSAIKSPETRLNTRSGTRSNNRRNNP